MSERYLGHNFEVYITMILLFSWLGKSDVFFIYHRDKMRQTEVMHVLENVGGLLPIEKCVLHVLVFCYFHGALASLQHGFHGRRKGWVLRKLLWVEIILFPFSKRCSWSPLQVPCLCSVPLELYARKQYDLSNWASGRRGTGWASMPWQLKPKNRLFFPPHE